MHEIPAIFQTSHPPKRALFDITCRLLSFIGSPGVVTRPQRFHHQPSHLTKFGARLAMTAIFPHLAAELCSYQVASGRGENSSATQIIYVLLQLHRIDMVAGGRIGLHVRAMCGLHEDVQIEVKANGALCCTLHCPIRSRHRRISGAIREIKSDQCLCPLLLDLHDHNPPRIP
jgi:hypothetical protein